MSIYHQRTESLLQSINAKQAAEIRALKELVRKMASRLDSFGYPYPRQEDMELLKEAQEAAK